MAFLLKEYETFKKCPSNVDTPDVLYTYYAGPCCGPRDFVETYKKLYPVFINNDTRSVVTKYGEIYLPPFASMEEFLFEYYGSLFMDPLLNPASSLFFVIEKDDVVLDLGSCEGLYSLYSIFNGAKAVCSIDPSPLVQDSLQKTFKGISNIDICNKAAACSEGSISLLMAGWGSTIARKDYHHSDIEETVVTKQLVDNLVRHYNYDKVDLIKMDIEGAEADALLGARDTISKYKPKIMASAYHTYTDAFLMYKILRFIRDDYNILLWGCRDSSYPIQLIAW